MTQNELLHLAEEAGFVFKARTVRKGSPDIRLTAAEEGKNLTVEVERVFRSTEVLRHLTGRQVIVLSEGADAFKEGASVILFSNCVVLGNHIVVREVGHIDSSAEADRDVEQTVRAIEERPLQLRVTEADAVITGKVLSSRRAEEPSIYRSEHDPEWWIARVQVLSVLKGKLEGEVEVLFPNSTDIAWYKAPKLHEGVAGILLLWRAKAADKIPEKARGMYQVTDPLDLLPMDQVEQVQRLLGPERRRR